jgi:hypothetical protein
MQRDDFQIFSRANLETGLTGGSVDMLERKIGQKMAGPAHFEVRNFVLFR